MGCAFIEGDYTIVSGLPATIECKIAESSLNRPRQVLDRCQSWLIQRGGDGLQVTLLVGHEHREDTDEYYMTFQISGTGSVRITDGFVFSDGQLTTFTGLVSIADGQFST